MSKKKFCITLISTAFFIVIVSFFIIYFSMANTYYYNNFNFLSCLQLRKSDWPSGESPDPIWSPDNISYKKNQMDLCINKNENGLTAGEVTTKRSFGYGLYQVSMKPIKHSGVVSAFFNFGKKDNLSTEIDIEFLGYDTTKVQFNYHTNGVGGHEYLYDLGFDASEDYHTYAFYWKKNSIYWYVDDVLAYEIHAEDIPEIEAPIVMDVWAGGKEEWLCEYDGATPLYANYQWFSYTSPDYVSIQ
ncbi:family 16 glycosylhydrolase [Butyrivibrio sp. AE3006]|uniref:family 16 glycosylhydrolase n=1 Tax=Butyrivibrio sp. AE3006 TaxID=1280673 RepID=UPI0004184975|nr:family 16 glycosylhydrolase [Butyrivibrio sp. AE3006]